jgi:RNA polymerase sigma factor (TIGR02999 family)
MPAPKSAEITQLLQNWAAGDDTALDQLTPHIYKELRRIAANCLRNERAGCSIQATALVHEAFIRLMEGQGIDWERRAHFYAVAARVMRHILLDRARRRAAVRRGGGAARINLDEVPDFGRSGELVALDDALTRLAASDPRKGRIVELRFFGGLTVEETAAVLKVSPQTVLRDWSFARAWLLSELS